MSKVQAGILAYMVFGLVVAYVLDRRQMKQHVPYGTLPSICSLKTLRICVYILSMFLSGGMAVWYSMEKVRMRFWSDKNGEEV